MSRILGAQPGGGCEICMQWAPQEVWLRRGHKVGGQGALETIQMSTNMGTDTLQYSHIQQI